LASKWLKNPILCEHGDPVVVDSNIDVLEFRCRNRIEVSNPTFSLNHFFAFFSLTINLFVWFEYPKCWWSEYLYGPKSHWPMKKEEVVVERTYVGRKCPCGVPTIYGLVPSKLGVCHYCGYMVGRDEVSHAHDPFKVSLLPL
jgi:hypothetical protein